MYNTRNIIITLFLIPVITILLFIGWFQQSTPHTTLEHTNFTQTPDESYIIAGYFINWGIYDRDFNVVDLKATKMSHVLYAFANVNKDGTVVLGDPWADTDIKFTPEKTVDGVQDGWKENDEDLHGNFKQLALLKQANRHLKVSLSIGGWSWSTHFSQIAAHPDTRSQFVTTAIDHLTHLGLDGIDIDWEFPKDKKDAENYVLLLKEIREALDLYQQRYDPTDEPFLLSVAMPTGPENYKILPLHKIREYVDIFYLMAYDFAGDWDDVTGHQSALYGGALNVDQAVMDFIAAGVPPKKIVVGLPLYGRGFSHTQNKTGSSYKGVPDGSWEKGSYDYKDLPMEDAIEYYDSERVASWSYNTRTNEFVTYDTPTVVRKKCEYITDKQLGGAMFWELSADSTTRSLVDTVYASLGSNLNKDTNHIKFPLSRYHILQ
ncbi:chitinase [Pilobolus umbonatus]|nr:chitinase [Pilobolus umbonatus]